MKDVIILILQKDADLALNTIVKIETGKGQNPTVDTLEKLAKALAILKREAEVRAYLCRKSSLF